MTVLNETSDRPTRQPPRVFSRVDEEQLHERPRLRRVDETQHFAVHVRPGSAAQKDLRAIAEAFADVAVGEHTRVTRPFDITVLRPDRTIGIYHGSSSSPLRVTLPVTEGLTYQIDVVHVDGGTREFELTTALQP